LQSAVFGLTASADCQSPQLVRHQARAGTKSTLLHFVLTMTIGDLDLDVFDDFGPDGCGKPRRFRHARDQRRRKAGFLVVPVHDAPRRARASPSASACLSRVPNPAATSASQMFLILLRCSACMAPSSRTDTRVQAMGPRRT